MIEIKDISGKTLMTVPVSSGAISHEELMKSDYIQLEWNSPVGDILPAGAFIEYDGEKYSLLEPYQPACTSEAEYQYTPQFQSRIMAWDKHPVPLYTYDDEGNIVSREFDWEFTGSPADVLYMVKQAIMHEVGEEWTYQLSDSLPATVSLQSQSSSIFSILSELAEDCETEWWVDKKNNLLHLSKCEHGERVMLTAGQNVKMPSITNSKDGYYTRFYVFGSTKNITQDYQSGQATNHIVNKRLTLDPLKYPGGYKDIKGHFDNGVFVSDLLPGEIFPKSLYFDNIFPSSKLTITNVRPRAKYRLDSNGNKIQIGGTEDEPVYEQYAIWYFRVEGLDFDPQTIIEGKNLSVSFESGQLAGRDFELTYHEKDQTVKDAADVTGFEVKAGDFEIIIDESTGSIIPGAVYIIPQDGDKIVLYNIEMPDEYTTSAQVELEAEIDKEIARRIADNNTYEFDSNPVDFYNHGTDVVLGQSVRFSFGGSTLETRVLMVEKRLDGKYQQRIRIGNEQIKGATQELKEDVANANQNIDIIKAFNELSSSLSNAYANAQREMIEGFAAIRNMWRFDPENPNTIYSSYNVYSLGEVAAGGPGSSSGGGTGGLDENQLWAILANTGTEQISKTHLVDALSGYATENWVLAKNYLTSAALSGYATQSWVTAQGYITSAALEGYATESWVTGKNYLTAITKAMVEAVLTGNITTHTHSQYLTAHQAIYALTIKAGSTTAVTFSPKTAAATLTLEAGSGISLSVDATAKKITIANTYKYTLPTASASVLGGVKIGANITITNGVISTHAPYSHPTATANTIAAATGKVLSAITVNSLGHVTSVAAKTLAAGDIPTLSISKISGLQTSLDSKLNASVFNELFEKVTQDGHTFIKAKYNFYSVGEVAAGGTGTGSGSTGGGIDEVQLWAILGNTGTEQISKTHLTTALSGYATETWVEGKGYATQSWVTAKGYITADALSGYATEEWVEDKGYITSYTNNYLTGVSGNGNSTVTFTRAGLTSLTWNAYHTHTFDSLTSKPTTLAGYGITDGVNAVSVTGSGNAITAASISGHTLTLTKGSTFLLSSAYTAADILAKLKTVDGSGSGLDADLLDGIHKTDFLKKGTRIGAVDWNTLKESYIHDTADSVWGTNTPTSVYKYGQLVILKGSTSVVQMYIPHSNTEGIRLRITWDGTDAQWGNWKKLALTTDNVASATKLQTPRTIWGRSFDGTANVSGDMSSVGNITMTGNIVGFGAFRTKPGSDNRSVYLDTNGLYYCAGDNGWAMGINARNQANSASLGAIAGVLGSGDSLTYTYYGGSYDNPAMVIMPNKNIGIGTKNPEYKLYVAGTIGAANLITAFGGLTTTQYIQIGSGRIYWDATNNALYVKKSDGTACNFYSLGEIAVGGAGTGSGGTGGGIDEEQLWAILGNTGTEQIAKNHLTSALAGYLTSVSLSTIKDLHANWDAVLKIAPTSYVTRWPTFAEVTSKPTTLAGYGITDAYTKTESDDKYRIVQKKSVSSFTSSGSWYRIAQSSATNTSLNYGKFYITDKNTGSPFVIKIDASISYNNSPTINAYYYSAWQLKVTKARIVYASPYTTQRAYLEIYINSNSIYWYNVDFEGYGWELITPIATTEEYTEKLNAKKEISLIGGATNYSTNFLINGNTVLHTGNYTTTLDNVYVKRAGSVMTGSLTIPVGISGLCFGTSSSTYEGGRLLASSDGRMYLQAGTEGKLSITGRNAVNLVDLSIKADSATINGNEIWHAGNDGSGSGLNADLLDGTQGANYLKRVSRIYNSIDYNNYTEFEVSEIRTTEITTENCPFSGYGLFVNLRDADGNGKAQIAFGGNRMYVRGTQSASQSITVKWNNVAYITDNVASASKLTTTTAGSATRPVYFANGIPVAGTYTFGNASGNAAINNGTLCSNLNADMLDGEDWSSFNIEKLYTIEASSLDDTKFYPIYFYPSTDNLLLEIKSPGGQGSAEYNTNRFRAIIHSCGWDDSGEALVMLSRFNYQDTEITIGAIGFGNENGGIAVWVRGGRRYYVRCNRIGTLKTSNYTYGTETYTVGTNLYGGTNTKVTIKWQNNTDRAKYDVALISSNVASANKLYNPRTIWGQSFDGTANVSGSLSTVGSITGAGDLALIGKGQITLRYNDAENNSVILTANSFRPILGSHNNIDLGASTARWRNLYSVLGNFSGAVTMSSSLKVEGTTALGSLLKLYNSDNTYRLTQSINGTASLARIYMINEAGSAYGDLSLGHSGSTAIYIKGGNNVGIGTNSPSYKLHIAGSFAVTANTKTITIYSENASWCHYRTTATNGHWFGNNVTIQGNLESYGGTKNLGASDARWNLYAGTGNFSGAVALSSTLSVASTSTFTGKTTHNGGIACSNGLTLNSGELMLGSSSNQKIRKGAASATYWSQLEFMGTKASNGSFTDIMLNIQSSHTIQFDCGGNFIWFSKGNIAAKGELAAGSSSDRRLKKILSTADYRKRLLSLGDVVDYEYNDKAFQRNARTTEHRRYTGLIWQNVVNVLPQMAGMDDDGYGYLNYIHTDYINLIAGALQQTIRRQETIEQRVARLEKENAELKQQLKRLAA